MRVDWCSQKWTELLAGTSVDCLGCTEGHNQLQQQNFWDDILKGSLVPGEWTANGLLLPLVDPFLMLQPWVQNVLKH